MMLAVSRRLIVASIIPDVHLTVVHRLFVFGRQLSPLDDISLHRISLPRISLHRKD